MQFQLFQDSFNESIGCANDDGAEFLLVLVIITIFIGINIKIMTKVIICGSDSGGDDNEDDDVFVMQFPKHPMRPMRPMCPMPASIR